jgi:hypothetical protein
MNHIIRGNFPRSGRLKTCAISGILAAGIALLPVPMLAGTLAVTTNPSCEPTFTHFTTIQAAVTAAPATGTTTILVCPGTYPEQVLINGKNITLKGVAFGGADAAMVTAPSGGLATNATSIYSDTTGGVCGGSGGCVQAQILVQNTTDATIEDLTLDATNTNLTSCVDSPIGIFFQNASGTITRNSILNDIQPAGYTGCQGGLGIYVESGTTTIQPNPSTAAPANLHITYNNVASYQKNGITGNATGVDVTISDNVVVGEGPWNGAGQNSIQIAFGAAGSVTSNTVGSDVWAPDVYGDTGDAAAGILVGYGSENVSITSNQVSNTQYGIAVAGYAGYGAGDGATVKNNTITLTHLYDAIDLCANNTTATGNKITGADESGVHIDDTCFGSATGNSVSSNTINGSCAGVLSGPTMGNTIGTNTYYNVVSQVSEGSDTCTPAPIRANGKPGTKPHWRLHPVGPSLQ